MTCMGSIERERGAATAKEVRVAANKALSWWEASEDLLRNLASNCHSRSRFHNVDSPLFAAPMIRRERLRSTIMREGSRLTEEEKNTMLDVMARLDALSATAALIPHGCVMGLDQRPHAITEKRGYFLICSIGAPVPKSEVADKVLTLADLNTWIAEVRHESKRIMSIAERLKRRNRFKRLLHFGF